MDKYYLALGRFIDRYAACEGQTFFLTLATANMTMDVAQALLSGTRTTAAIKFMRRMYEARNATVPTRLDAAFKQLGSITTLRDHLLHTGVVLSEAKDELVSTNWIRAHAERAKKETKVSAELLDDMTADLDTISAILQVHFHLRYFPDAFSSAEDQRGLLYSEAQRPWRYTP
jgi:hypothetical protein